MSTNTELLLELTELEYRAVIAGELRELARPAGDDWFEKLYETDTVLGIPNPEQERSYARLRLRKAGKEDILLPFRGFEIEEDPRQAEESDERFNFMIRLPVF